MQIAILLGLLTGVAADCYLQYPAGGNNRLDEGGGNRNNNNRLMDTQNNAKGGYGYGGDSNNPADPLKYMANSVLTTSWTSQHSCGSMNAECQIVVQYMCNPAAAAPAGVPAPTGTNPAPTANTAGEGPLRDGTNNDTPDPNNPDADTGLHEPASFYEDCTDRERNKGLYTADQNMNNNNGAAATRQNPNGNRSGQECPEERDYYPYWHPSPWKDVAILTNNLALCDWYKAESQNVKGKNYCTVPSENNAADCTNAGGTWETQAAFGIPPPECIAAPYQRDNHLGNGANGQEIMYNWTIPSAAGVNGVNDATNCVMRYRYNITTADTQVCEDKSITTKAACVAAGKIWSAAYLDSSYNDDVDNGEGANGNNNPGLLEQNPDTDLGGLLTDGGGTDSLLELAVNTNQYGRTFQDRTHVFEIQDRPAAVGLGTTIYNLNVKGKRGNIVQTYPATEYDFNPNILEVGANDFVHIQWTGNDNTNNNGGNNGEGTNDEDRHNIVQMASAGVNVGQSYDQQSMFDVEWEWNPDTTGTFSGTRDKNELTKQFALVKQTGCDENPNNDQARDNCQKLNSAAATVDLGLLKFKPGNFEYASTRNNNFSNRAQKANLKVSTSPNVTPQSPVAVSAAAVPSGSKDGSRSVEVSWAAPGGEAPATGFDGKAYWNMEQQQAEVVSYMVEYSLEGGADGSWVDAGQQCTGNINTCEVSGLPAGTPVVFRVVGGSTGGYGLPSDITAVKTDESDASKACNAMLMDQASGSYFAPGSIVAIVFGVLAILCLVGAGLFILKRRQPPPPPGTYKTPAPPAY
jgi:hypothetical protein